MTDPTPQLIRVYCEDCGKMKRNNKSDPPWRWLCTEFKRGEGFGYITLGVWDDFPPYHYCNEINRSGTCPLYEEKRDDANQ